MADGGAVSGPGATTPGLGPMQECRHLMAWSGSERKVEGRRFPRVVRGLLWLRGHRDVVVALTVAGIAVSFILDLLIPGYAIAGFYLVPLLLVAFALRERRAVVAASVSLCLGLTVFAMVAPGPHERPEHPARLVRRARGSRPDRAGLPLQPLRPALRDGTRRRPRKLQSLTAQLQRLQEVSVLDSDRPLSELLARHRRAGAAAPRAATAAGCSGSTPADESLRLQAAVGVARRCRRRAMSLPIGNGPRRSGRRGNIGRWPTHRSRGRGGTTGTD